MPFDQKPRALGQSHTGGQIDRTNNAQSGLAIRDRDWCLIAVFMSLESSGPHCGIARY